MSEGKKRNVRRMKASAAATVVAVLALVAAVVFGVLYASARVPQDAAARIDDEYLLESELSDYIAQERIAAQATEDADFARYLSASGLNVATYRINSINQIALSRLINKRAAELNLVTDDAEVDEQVKAYKKNLAFDDDEIWNDTLAQQGMSDEGIRKQLATNLLEQKLYDKEVAHRNATDDETLSYMQSHLAGQTLRHACRLCFTGSDGWERAQEVYEQLKTAKKLDAESFEELGEAAAQEDESDLQQGPYAWSDEADLSEEVKNTLDALRAKGCKLAIGSSSKNTKLILTQIGLRDYFDAISDGNNIIHSKPDPEVDRKSVGRERV